MVLWFFGRVEVGGCFGQSDGGCGILGSGIGSINRGCGIRDSVVGCDVGGSDGSIDT